MQIASRELLEFVSLVRLSQERIHHECGGMLVFYSCVSSSCSDSSSGSGDRRSVNRRKCTEGGVMFVQSLSRSPSSFPSPPVSFWLRHILAFPSLSSHLLSCGCGLTINNAMSSLLRMPTVLTKFQLENSASYYRFVESAFFSHNSLICVVTKSFWN